MFGDIKSARLLFAKGALFVLLGCLAGGALILRHPSLADFGLLVIAVWAFCRAYYFAFYVIQHYLDPNYRFDGLASFFAYAMSQNWSRENTDGERD